ncbi:hypothetical protein BN1323_160039 [Staphylococcus aureus]|nr:hypothetical protein BN1323_160039 [Staphylococcus aureus]CRI20502.1 hypothetical protein BN1322_370037 [Staphylococcus aureus]CRI20767.1 hypothetical protein SAET23_360040 [Staphylococcus aureus]CRI27580.1 hypothetical protein SAET23_360040 [Staphylococcus aureus]
MNRSIYFLGGQLLCVKHLWQMNQTLSANGMLSMLKAKH